MSYLSAALWAEALKARRSKLPWLAGLGFSVAPLIDGLFMWILKDPERARSLGLISAKAQLAAGVADWPTCISVLLQATAVGGGIVFSLVTAWLFGREFSDHTAKDLLALPAPRGAVVAAKFIVLLVWTAILAVLVYALGLASGAAVGLPGWSPGLARQGAIDLAVTAILTLVLMPPVAYFASAGGGYLPALGWIILTMVLAQILAVLGWGAWFPWSVPALFSGMAGPRADLLGPHSFIMVALAGAAGLAATFAWWYKADQTR
jgi:ABC-2 type transport system permease protein